MFLNYFLGFFLGGVVCLFVHLLLGKHSATKLQSQPCSLILKIEMLLWKWPPFYHIAKLQTMRLKLGGCLVFGVKRHISFPYLEPYDLERNVTPLFHRGKAPGEWVTCLSRGGNNSNILVNGIKGEILQNINVSGKRLNLDKNGETKTSDTKEKLQRCKLSWWAFVFTVWVINRESDQAHRPDV